MRKATKMELIFALVIFIGCIVFALVDPLTKLAAKLVTRILSNLELYIETGFTYGIVVIFIAGILYVGWRFVRYRWSNRDTIKARKEARKEHPDLFEEMQSVLRSILLPVGFKEEKVRTKDVDKREPKTYADFKQDGFTVSLWVYMIDSSYHLDAWHWEKKEDGRRKKLKDFSLDGWDIMEADKFKSLSVEKLNEWLIKQGIK